MILQPVLLVGVFMTGRMKAILRMPLGKVLIAFTAWIMFCVPFSVWRGGSFSTFLIVLQALALVVFMAAFIRTIADCFRAMYTIALAAASIGLVSLVVHSDKINNPRLGTRRHGRHFGRSQLSLPLHTHRLAFSLALRFREDWLQEGNVAVLDGSYACRRCSNRIKNGTTRSGRGLVLLSHFCVSQTEDNCHCRKGSIFLILALFFLPQRIRERFTTYFEAHSAQAEEAAESAEFRKRLLIRGLELTAEHPLFGVGPGQFIVAEAKEAQEAGSRADVALHP